MPDRSGRDGAPVRIREIRSARDAAFPAAHRLLRRIFPKAEMSPLGDWAHTLEERAQRLWTDIAWHLVVAEQENRVIGAASGTYLGNLNLGVVGYVALSKQARARGLGPRLRRHLAAAFARDALRIRGRRLEAIIGEVHLDNPWLRTLVERHGAIALDFPYQQPALGRKARPVPIVLYYQPLTRTRRSLGAAELRRLLYSLYRRGYRIARPLGRPEFRRMLRSLKGKRRVGARELPAG
jgi:hypothetical protein